MEMQLFDKFIDVHSQYFYIIIIIIIIILYIKIKYILLDFIII